MGWRTRVEEFCMNSEEARRLQVVPQGCGACWGLLHYKDRHAPSQLCRTQDWRNESPMNGLLCVTMTVALGDQGNVRGPCNGWAVWVCMSVCESEYTEKLLRNVRTHAKDKEFESHSTESYPSSLLWRNITVLSKGLACEPHWMELMEVLCTGLILLEKFNWWAEISSCWWISSNSRREN